LLWFKKQIEMDKKLYMFSKGLFLSLLALNLPYSHAQHAMTSMGGSISGPGGKASFSVGQLADKSFTGSNGSFTQGVQQWIVENPLPVGLVNFAVEYRSGEGVYLSWSTMNERQNSYFSVESSRDGRKFRELGRVQGRGESDQKVSYHFTDLSPHEGQNYYRLKQMDHDGTPSYSTIRVVEVKLAQMAAYVYPNPASERILLQGIGWGPKSVRYRLTSLDGREVGSGTLREREQGVDIRHLPAGGYLLTVYGENDRPQQALRVIKE
jgi:hypothetical protein